MTEQSDAESIDRMMLDIADALNDQGFTVLHNIGVTSDRNNQEEK